jgi:hypothetical protein
MFFVLKRGGFLQEMLRGRSEMKISRSTRILSLTLILVAGVLSALGRPYTVTSVLAKSPSDSSPPATCPVTRPPNPPFVPPTLSRDDRSGCVLVRYAEAVDQCVGGRNMEGAATLPSYRCVIQKQALLVATRLRLAHGKCAEAESERQTPGHARSTAHNGRTRQQWLDQ